MSMHRGEGPPPIDERYRVPLRVGVIFASYALYFVLSDERVVPAVFLGLGALLLGLALVDRWTLRRPSRSGLLQVGMTILGIGLLGLGFYLFMAGDRSL